VIHVIVKYSRVTPWHEAFAWKGSVARVFLLSPANCSGVRAQQVMSPAARFDLAARLRGPAGVPIGEVFSFVSGLYFRGKLAYARRFAAPPDDGGLDVLAGGVLVITPGAGLRSADTPVTIDALQLFARIGIDVDNPAYRRPLEMSARTVAEAAGADCEVVLLGSIASPKYVEVLLGIFGDRLLFPAEFVGRGDMSRGGLLLRHVRAGAELEYIPARGAVRHGKRPARLAPLRKDESGAS
jgi:hypothetical protein